MQLYTAVVNAIMGRCPCHRIVILKIIYDSLLQWMKYSEMFNILFICIGSTILINCVLFYSKRDINSKLTDLVKISDTKVTVAFSGKTEEEPLRNPAQTSSEWYFLTLAWSAGSGNLTVRKNGIQIGQVLNYAKRQKLPDLYVYISSLWVTKYCKCHKQ